jgi:hypothetical protein
MGWFFFTVSPGATSALSNPPYSMGPICILPFSTKRTVPDSRASTYFNYESSFHEMDAM